MNNFQLVHNIHQFWFGNLSDLNSAPDEARTKLWFGYSPEVDGYIKERFSAVLEEVAQGQHTEWLTSSIGAVITLIVLAQFPRRIYRKTKRAFAYDERALSVAKQLVERGLQRDLHILEQVFCYLPYEHSESLEIQQESVRLFRQLQHKASQQQFAFCSLCLEMARKHLIIIERFGRFPQRNEVLARQSSEAEVIFLAQEHDSFWQ